MTTPTDILDTAVKIGLGALISGVTSYLTFNSNNAFELRKILLEDRRSTLREIALTVEESIGLLNDFVLIYQSNIQTANINNIGAKLHLIVDSHKISNKAEALANMIGFSALSSAINEYDKSVSKILNIIGNLPDKIDRYYLNEYLEIINENEKAIKQHIFLSYEILNSQYHNIEYKNESFFVRYFKRLFSMK